MTRGSSLNTCLNISKIMSFNLLLTSITLYIYIYKYVYMCVCVWLSCG